MTTETAAPSTTGHDRQWVYDLLLAVILLLGAYFRFSGVDWDEYQYLHPDERFLTFVETSIQPVQSLGEYFDTANSPLNPHNRGHGFFVYGTLPIFLVRYVAEWLGKTGYGDIAQIGRPLSALFDLATVLVMYAAASRLYDRRVGLLAAAFSAFAVLQIQLSHFFTVDIFANFFIWLALYFGVRIVTAKPVGNRGSGIPNPHPSTTSEFHSPSAQDVIPNPHPSTTSEFHSPSAQDVIPNTQLPILHPILLPTLLFGLATGMAMASKISAAPVALMLPLAVAVYLWRLPEKERNAAAVPVLLLMGLAGLLSFVTFRFFQPYAFEGPGFFDIGLNEQWVDNLRSLSGQVQPDSGFPPSVQWFNRLPVLFAGWNLTVWGLGLPLGVLAWAGFLWVGWRIWAKKEWQHLLLWGWTAVYFLWQSSVPNPTMRYQLPVYPGMALFAAWAVVRLWEAGRSRVENRESRAASRDTSHAPRTTPYAPLPRALAVILGGLVLLATLLYAFAFSWIYRQPVTRIAASRWMYRNIPGPINLRLQTAEGDFQQPIPFPDGAAIRPGAPFETSFTARATGTLSGVFLNKIVPQTPVQEISLRLSVLDSPSSQTPLATALLSSGLSPNAPAPVFALDQPLPLQGESAYTLQIELLAGAGELDLCGPLAVELQTASGPLSLTLPEPEDCTLRPDAPLRVAFVSPEAGALSGVALTRARARGDLPGPLTFRLALADQPDLAQPLAQASLTFDPQADADGYPTFTLDTPLPLREGETYYLRLSLESGGAAVALGGAAIAVESSWDDALPLRLDGYDGYGGIYQGGLNFEMYWNDDQNKRQRFIDTLNQADVIAISSSRQWASLTRMPEKWPLVETYYRNLLGCPPERTVEWCYNVAEPGTFTGSLGFDLVETFQSDPQIFGLRINDQFAEEAFTVYDHPKVFIFVKSEAYDPARVRALFEAAPLAGEEAQPAQPRPAEPSKSLMLTPEQLAVQRSGGTWSELFDPEALINRFQPLTVVVWYLALAVVGLVSYPLVRLALPGLADRGYPLARTAGLLLLSYLVWLGGSFGVPVTRWMITGAFLLLAAVGGGLAYLQREALRRELQSRWHYFALVEVLALAFFVFLLFVRWANPDLWHPWKGGEKPMDFAYFNAVLKSTIFPPYDPWFAGGYINYYYYGFVFVGVLVKWLGIVPAIAYNLALPALFSTLALGAFSIAWNLVRQPFAVFRRGSGQVRHSPPFGTAQEGFTIPRTLPYISGFAASVGVALLGNLGTLRMIVQGYQRVAAPPGALLEETFFLTRWVWAVRGFLQVLQGASLPYALADWYWNPSRAIPAPNEVEPITEFPFFTFLYADLHAHLIALPIAVLALAWAVSVVLAKGRWESKWAAGLGFLLGGLAIGALRPTNTWDYPTYLGLGMLAAGVGVVLNQRSTAGVGLWGLPRGVARGIGGLLAAGLLAGLSWFLYQPYTRWYALGYTQVSIWRGTHTPINAYVTHWGVFLFVIFSWMAWETREWMATTPVSALRRLLAYRDVLVGSGVALAGMAGWLMVSLEVSLAWLVIAGGVWAGVLILRPGMPDAKRVVLFLIGSGLFLTLLVEVVVLSGDIGRMNTVFKFYMQVWVLFAISAAAALGWLLPELRRWVPQVQRVWRLAMAFLVFAALLFPLLGGPAKMQDRMAEDAPRTLDGMAYMAYARYSDQGKDMNLDEDYRAIRWLQDNVVGSPVIVEGHTVEYRWGSRYAIYTGLPAVLGWNWHQRQQRTGQEALVWQRVAEIEDFYVTTNRESVRRFLEAYDVKYIIVGQMERAYYDGPGLEKFDAWEGDLWRKVYQDGETAIYEVIE